MLSYFKNFPERSIKKRNFETSCVSDIIWFSSQFFQRFISIISNLISFYTFFLSFSFRLTIAQIFRGIFPRNIISTVKFQLLFFRQPCPAQDNQTLYPAYIEIRERNNISSVPSIAKIRNFHNSWRCSSNSIQIFNYEWNSRGGREGRESKSRGKGRKDNAKGNKIRCRVMDTAYILGRNFSRAEREPRRFNKLAEVATKIRALFSREWIVTGRFNLWLPTFLVPLPRCRRLRGEKEEGGERERRGSERRIKVITGHSFLSRRGFSLVSKRSLSPEIGRIFFNFHAWISHTLFDIPF